jgi:hypothetical protein
MSGLLSPAGLGHARHFAGVYEFTKTNSAQAELAKDSFGPSASLAAGIGTHLVFGRCLLLDYESLFRHGSVPFALEREAERFEERFALSVGACGRTNGDVHASNLIDLVVFDFGEDGLLGNAERVVASSVKGLG